MDNKSTEKPPLSREAIRIQKEKEEAEFKERDRKRVEVEKEYAKKKRKKLKPLKKSRIEVNGKTNYLKRRLNIAILIVLGLIIIVFLILFFL